MKNNRIRLTESQLHKVIKESVKRVLREAKDTTFIDVKNDAKKKFDIVMSHMKQIGCPFVVNFTCGRNVDDYPHIGAEMDAHQIKTDYDFEYYWRTLVREMEQNNFMLVVGPVMDDLCVWSYDDERMGPMCAKHDERDRAYSSHQDKLARKKFIPLKDRIAYREWQRELAKRYQELIDKENN